MTTAGTMRTIISMIDAPDENVDWSRVAELRGQDMDAASALRQARQEHEVEVAVDDLGLEDEGDASGTCPIPEAVNWVADSIERSGVTADDAPSATAWMLLKWCKASEANKRDFITGIWAKLIPSKSELENQSRYRDDGSTQIELAERILARIEQQRVNDEVASELKRQQYERRCVEDHA